MPCHHNLETYLHAYIDGCGLASDPKGPLFRTIGRGTDELTTTPLPQANAYAMIRRRAASAGIETKIGNHTFRATGITAYLKNGGTLEKAAAMANHASTRTTQPLRSAARRGEPRRGRAGGDLRRGPPISMKDHERRAFYAIGKAVCDRFRLPEADPRRTARFASSGVFGIRFCPPAFESNVLIYLENSRPSQLNRSPILTLEPRQKPFQNQ